MHPRLYMPDAADAMTFLIQQAAYIEAEVYRTQYPDITYPELVPVDESAPEWTKSIAFYGMDHTGQAQWFNHMATDMRLADVTRTAYEQSVEMAGIGYRYTLEELGQAMQSGFPLNTERAAAATRAYEEFVERVAISGDTSKNWFGLINAPAVTAVNAPNGAGASPLWTLKTSDEILKDINDALTGIYIGTATIEMANTILLPIDAFTLIATKRLSDHSELSILEWIRRYNVYTITTGQPLIIRAVRQLKDAGVAGVDRMVAYRRDPAVVKMHVPMRHRFLPVWQTGPITFDIPGIFRLGGVEFKRPGSARYV